MSNATNTPIALVTALTRVEFCGSLALSEDDRVASVNGVLFSVGVSSVYFPIMPVEMFSHIPGMHM